MDVKQADKETDREVYVIRWWREPINGQKLRGLIQDVHSGKTFPITDPEKVMAVLEEQVKLADARKKASGLK